MSATRVHLTASIVAAVVALVMLLAAFMFGGGAVTSTQGDRTYECGSAWNIGTTPDNRRPVNFVVMGSGPRDLTYDGLTGCGEVKSDRNRLAIGAVCLGLLAAAAAVIEARRYRARRPSSSVDGGIAGVTN